MARYVRRKDNAGFNITSLMDMMTIILVFLLKSFSAEGQLLTNTDGLVLPNSTSMKSPTEAHLMVAITYDWIQVDNVPVVKTADVRQSSEILIPGVKDKMDVAMLQEENMVKVGALQRVKGEVVLQLDKNVEYDVLYKVMSTCGAAGFNSIMFAVMGRGE
ncbi:MAG: biopolymer transporter ExbD [Fibrobacteres bacterium]|nr:biopolymer transporter ExbD [Fibrobacterota bacterium]